MWGELDHVFRILTRGRLQAQLPAGDPAGEVGLCLGPPAGLRPGCVSRQDCRRSTGGTWKPRDGKCRGKEEWWQTV